MEMQTTSAKKNTKEIDQDLYFDSSAKIETSDLDWKAGGKAGLTVDEQFILTYFSDIESQTVVYLRDLLQTKVALLPESIAFLTIWNYEEFFHGQALARLMAECGQPLAKDRISKVREQAKLSEKLESAAANVLSKVFYHHFSAVYLAWGAVQELTTLRCYEALGASTQNPVLKTLCERIAKQERKHFAWYFNNARIRLQESAMARKLTRTLLQNFWSPVGAGVKTQDEVYRLVCTLFPGVGHQGLSEAVDTKISSLPGLEGLTIMENYFTKSQQKFKGGLSAARA